MRTCGACGAELVKRPKEAHWQFGKRTACSKRCAGLLGNPRHEVTANRYRYIKVMGRRVAEHRYVMEQLLGRRLLPTEHVHHKDHDRLNNDPANLEVVTVREHADRHTVHPVTKLCVVCGCEFTPHKTKRARAQTCSDPCKRRLLSIRNAERRSS